MSRIKKIGFLSFGQATNVLVNILFMPYMARSLSYEDYGSYGQALLIAGIFSGLFGVGLSQVIYIYLSDSTKSESQTYSSNMLACILSGIAGMCSLAMLSEFFSHVFNNTSLSTYLLTFSAYIPISILNASIHSFFIHQNKVKTSVVLLVFTNFLKILFVVLAIQLFSSVLLALCGILASILIQLILGILLTLKKIRLHTRFELLFEQMKSGFPLGLTAFVGMAILYTDGFMVSNMLGTKEYAIYRNGAFEVPFISTLYASIAAIILPEVSLLWRTQKMEEIVVLKRKVIMNTFMIVFPIMIYLIFFNTELIRIYLGDKYLNSAIIFAIFNLSLLIRINDYYDILIASNNTKYILYYNLFTLLLNIILNGIFITLLGSRGAAIATIVSLLIFAILHVKKTIQILGTSIFKLIHIHSVFKIIMVSCIIIIPIRFIFYQYTIPVVYFIIFSLFYFIIVYFMALKLKLFDYLLIEKILPAKLLHKFY